MIVLALMLRSIPARGTVLVLDAVCCHKYTVSSVCNSIAGSFWVPRLLIHVFVDLLQQRVQRGLRLGLFDFLNQVGVLRHQLTEIGHFLQQFGEEVD